MHHGIVFNLRHFFEINLSVYVVFTFNELNCFQGLNSKYDRKLPKRLFSKSFDIYCTVGGVIF